MLQTFLKQTWFFFLLLQASNRYSQTQKEVTAA